MTDEDRRPHWDDDLVYAVIHEIGVLRPSPHSLRDTAYAVIAAVEDWVYDNFQGGEYDNPVEFTPEELAIARVRQVLDEEQRGYNPPLGLISRIKTALDGEP